MKKRVVYRSGLWVDGVQCTWCRRKRRGIVMQNRIRWCVYLSCGHLAQRGSVLPVAALEAMKLVNQKGSVDPRAIAQQEFQAAERKKKIQDALDREVKMLDRTRQRYL